MHNQAQCRRPPQNLQLLQLPHKLQGEQGRNKPSACVESLAIDQIRHAFACVFDTLISLFSCRLLLLWVDLFVVQAPVCFDRLSLSLCCVRLSQQCFFPWCSHQGPVSRPFVQSFQNMIVTSCVCYCGVQQGYRKAADCEQRTSLLIPEHVHSRYLIFSEGLCGNAVQATWSASSPPAIKFESCGGGSQTGGKETQAINASHN